MVPLQGFPTDWGRSTPGFRGDQPDWLQPPETAQYRFPRNGEAVTLAGLNNKAHLNGMHGQILNKGIDGFGRVLVQLTDESCSTTGSSPKLMKVHMSRLTPMAARSASTPLLPRCSSPSQSRSQKQKLLQAPPSCTPSLPSVRTRPGVLSKEFAERNQARPLSNTSSARVRRAFSQVGLKSTVPAGVDSSDLNYWQTASDWLGSLRGGAHMAQPAPTR